MIALAHLELAVQGTRSRLSCEAVVRGRSGTATAQPASMRASATKIANFNVIELADASGRDAIIGSPLLAFALQSGRGGLTASYGEEERRINFNEAVLPGRSASLIKFAHRSWKTARGERQLPPMNPC